LFNVVLRPSAAHASSQPLRTCTFISENSVTFFS
jgi:hypothetical protein